MNNEVDKYRVQNLVQLLDGYFEDGGFHLNVNVLTKEQLLDAWKNPDKYPQLCVRVSGYCVAWNRLTDEQKQDVITRTFHESL